MSLRQYLIFLALGTAISISAWCIVTIAIDPVTAGPLAFAVFYITLGAGIAGLLTIIGTVVRSYRYTDEDAHRAVTRSFRQGVMLSALFLGCLMLLAKGLFSFGTMVLFIVLLGLFEFLIVSLKKEHA